MVVAGGRCAPSGWARPAGGRGAGSRDDLAALDDALTASASLRSNRRRRRVDGALGGSGGEPGAGVSRERRSDPPGGGLEHGREGSPVDVDDGLAGAQPHRRRRRRDGPMAPRPARADAAHDLDAADAGTDAAVPGADAPQMAGMSVQPPRAPVADAAMSQGVTEETTAARPPTSSRTTPTTRSWGLIAEAEPSRCGRADNAGNTLLMASRAAGHKRSVAPPAARSGSNRRNARVTPRCTSSRWRWGTWSRRAFRRERGGRWGTNNYGMSPVAHVAPENDGGGCAGNIGANVTKVVYYRRTRRRRSPRTPAHAAGRANHTGYEEPFVHPPSCPRPRRAVSRRRRRRRRPAAARRTRGPGRRRRVRVSARSRRTQPSGPALPPPTPPQPSTARSPRSARAVGGGVDHPFGRSDASPGRGWACRRGG